MVATTAGRLTRMGSYKRPRNKTIEGGRFRELLAESLEYGVGYQWYCVNNDE